jgi:hypothetical protein
MYWWYWYQQIFYVHKMGCTINLACCLLRVLVVHIKKGTIEAKLFVLKSRTENHVQNDV